MTVPFINKLAGINDTRTLPNGGGSYSVANSTPSGIIQDAPQSFSLSDFLTKQAQAQTPTVPPVTQVQEQPAQATVQQGGAQISPEALAFMDKYRNQPATPASSMRGLSDSLYQQWMQERNTNTGMFGMPENVSVTPEQMISMRKAADQYYSGMVNNALEKEKSGFATQMDFSSDPDVNALVSTGLIPGGTAGERINNARRIMSLSGDQKKQAINTIAYEKLGPTQKQNYVANQQAEATAENALSILSPELYNNPYKHTLNDYVTYLGGTKDPRYTNFMQSVASAVAPIRLSYFGASLTNGEQRSANEFLPDTTKDDVKTIAMKLRNVSSIAKFTNDVMISNILGTPRPKLSDYVTVNADGTPKKTTKESVTWDNILD